MPQTAIGPTECDVVMKGGITSGIVYPSLALELKRNGYMFRNIGGTSAGAIAAVGIAAAEYNPAPITPDNPLGGGYKVLQKDIEEWLGRTAPNGKDSNLRQMFQATPQTAPLMEILDAILSANATSAAKKLSASALAPPLANQGQIEGPPSPQNQPSAPMGKANPSAAQQSQPSAASNISRVLSNLFKFLGIFFKVQGVWFAQYLPLSVWAVAIALIGGILSCALPLAVFGLLYLMNPPVFANGLLALKIVLLVFALLGLWFGWHVGRLLAACLALPQHFFGVCTGHTNPLPAPDQATNLTDWLSDKIDMMAGIAPRTQPLTFGKLRNREDSKKPIELKMITSNISQGIPYVLPEGLRNYLFRQDEMRQFFPDYVVEQLMNPNPLSAGLHEPAPQPTIIPQHVLDNLNSSITHDLSRQRDKRLDPTYHFFPSENYIPVVVGARLSLSFPLLLAAIPLYTISSTAYSAYQQLPQQQKDTFLLQPEQGDIQKNWFSDGGISSNFPIQFFDAWLPGRPTFGVNLTKVGVDTCALDSDQTKADVSQATIATSAGANDGDTFVYLPGAEERRDPEWRELNALPAFAQAIFGTAQNYRDTLQANLPSYRERTVQIRLNNDEGGLNLSMSKDIITKVKQKGQLAGQALEQQFNFEHHLWVRFRVLMSQLEQNLCSLQVLMDNEGSTPLQKIAASLQQPNYPAQDSLPRIPYWKDQQWRSEAVTRLQVLEYLFKNWRIPYSKDGSECKTNFFSNDPPLPEPTLRVTPEI